MRVLTVVAHGDDETLGAGGTLARHVREGDEVAVLVLTDRDSSRHDRPELAASRVPAIEKAMDRLGVHECKVHALDDNQLDRVGGLGLSRLVAAEVRDWRPEVVYTHAQADLSADHRAVGLAAAVATRAMPGFHCDLYAIEVRSSTDTGEAGGAPPFRPSHWVALAASDVEAKLDALRAYSDEMRDWPHPRSLRAVRALVEYRGSQIGVEAAEAFSALRTVRTLGGGR